MKKIPSSSRIAIHIATSPPPFFPLPLPCLCPMLRIIPRGPLGLSLPQFSLSLTTYQTNYIASSSSLTNHISLRTRVCGGLFFLDIKNALCSFPSPSATDSFHTPRRRGWLSCTLELAQGLWDAVLWFVVCERVIYKGGGGRVSWLRCGAVRRAERCLNFSQMDALSLSAMLRR
jgi:hypothetical protein